MKNIFKTFAFLLLTAVFFQSCNSNESTEDIVSDEQIITTDLADKIITTATSLNDYNFYNKNANLDCNYYLYASFINPEGNFYDTAWISVGPTGLPQTTIEEEKTRAFEETGIQFTYNDFFIHSINTTNNYGTDREEYLDIFDDCNYENEKNPFEDFSIPLSDVNFNCNNTSVVYTVGSDLTDHLFSPLGVNIRVETSLNDGLLAVENQLIIFNNHYNTTYTLDDVRVVSLVYTSPAGREGLLFTKKRMLRYLENCSLARDASEDDCLNFVYPLQVNRTNQQMNEVITLENDDDLATTFGTNPSELAFVFPINLLGANGTAITIDTNEALETALDSAAIYCE